MEAAVDTSKYGPFVNVVAVACALAAVFSTLLLRALGSSKKWTWLAGNQPAFMVKAGGRVLAVSIMAVTYIFINPTNYLWFAGASVVIGIICFVEIVRFDKLRRRHVLQVPVTGKGGVEVGTTGLIIGRESEMNEGGRKKWHKARKKGASLMEFLGGTGTPPKMYDAGVVWDHELLADIGSRLTTILMIVFLSAVTTLFLAAFAVVESPASSSGSSQSRPTAVSAFVSLAASEAQYCKAPDRAQGL
jgi:hypothetical protein